MKKIKLDLKNPKLRIPLVLVSIALLSGYLWYDYIYVPTKQTLTVLEKKRNANQDTLRTIQALKPQLGILRNEISAAQKRLDSLKAIFPDQKEVPKLLREITGVARASGIVTTKFNPLPDVENEYYLENRYNIAVEGTFHGLAEFFAFVANFPLIVNFSSVNIVTNPNSGSYQNTDRDEEIVSVVSSFEMTTFSSKK
jgi:type IV pilus assembly protein PilO